MYHLHHLLLFLANLHFKNHSIYHFHPIIPHLSLPPLFPAHHTSLDSVCLPERDCPRHWHIPPWVNHGLTIYSIFQPWALRDLGIIRYHFFLRWVYCDRGRGRGRNQMLITIKEILHYFFPLFSYEFPFFSPSQFFHCSFLYDVTQNDTTGERSYQREALGVPRHCHFESQDLRSPWCSGQTSGCKIFPGSCIWVKWTVDGVFQIICISWNCSRNNYICVEFVFRVEDDSLLLDGKTRMLSLNFTMVDIVHCLPNSMLSRGA